VVPTSGNARTVAIGVVAPHGDLAIADACDDATRSLALQTQAAMGEMGRCVSAANPDCVIVATPHNVHVAGHMAVLTASEVAGQLDESPSPISLSARVDRELALGIHDELNDADVPTVAVSFGGNDPAEAVAPLDWGVIVPLWHVGRFSADIPVVVVAPARDLDPTAHVRAGAAVVRAAAAGGRRIAFIASADQGHGHRADGPYGFHAESAPFDARIVDLVGRNALHELVDIDPGDVGAALADSWWQMLILHGALSGEDGDEFTARVLAYEAPTYYGMLTALFEPPAAGR
jgi:aromatic ring-opening dioxygenase LigB subunit